MLKDIHVIIVEDDPYARDFMSMLLRREWRTRVVGEYGSSEGAELQHALHQFASPVDVLVVDTEVPSDEQWPARVAHIVRSLPEPPAILYTCTYPEVRALSHALETHSGGYVCKEEIRYGLASAISAAAQGKFVITPGVQRIADQMELPEHTQVMDGTIPVATFTPRESELSRLGLLFNLSQRDIADDLVVSSDFVAEVMGQVYEKLGLRDILSGEKPLEEYFQDEMLIARCRSVLEKSGLNSKPQAPKATHKAPWMPTIAFHLLTRPDVEEMG